MTGPPDPNPNPNPTRPPSSSPKFPNPRESMNPEAASLRENWRYAVRLYSKWYSQAWGSAILAGLSFFALGWAIKGENPIKSLTSGTDSENQEKKKNGG